MPSRASRRAESCLVALVALAALSGRAVADPDLPAADLDHARTAHAAGVTSYRLGKFEDAARQFEESYRLTKFPAILFDLALANRRLYETTKDLDRLRRAIDLYKAFLHESPATADKRPLATQILPQLEQIFAGEIQHKRQDMLAKAVGADGLFLADQLLSEGATQDAQRVLERILGSRANPRDVVLGALQKLALVEARLGHAKEATDAFERALALDPGFLLPDGVDHATATAYAAARQFWVGKSPFSISQTPPGTVASHEPARIAVRIDSDPLKMVRNLEVHYRLAGSGAYSTSRFSPETGHVEVPASFVADPRGGTRIEYYVAALGEADGQLALLGSAKEPFVFIVGAPAGANESIKVASSPRRGWYRKWYVWTLAVVLAGAGAGTAAYVVTRGPQTYTSVTIPTQ